MPDLSGASNPFSGRWIARVRNNIICQGGSADQVFRAAKSIRGKEKIIISFIPLNQPMPFPQMFYKIQEILSDEAGIFLVGGAIRNALLGQAAHDLDFAVEKNTEKLARKVSRELQSSFFPLDNERETYRLILKADDGQLMNIDFAGMRGGNIDSDLESRDFTINAMAVNLNDPQKLIDPLGGAQDLKEKVVKSCTPRSIQDDPIRILRAIRFAAEGGYKIADETRHQMKISAGLLTLVTPERKRDEIFKMMNLDQLPAAIRALEWLDSIQILFPGLVMHNSDDAKESLPKIKKQDHSTSETINQLVKVITRMNSSGEGGTLYTGMVGSVLSGFRQALRDYLQQKFTPDRNIYQLIQFSNLLINLSGNRNQFNDPVINVIKDMNFSREEVRFIKLLTLQIDPVEPTEWFENRISRKDAFLYFKSYGLAGIANTLLVLGRFMASNTRMPDPDKWKALLDQVYILWDAWWNRSDEIVNPILLLDGDEIARRFNLSPGPAIGKCLEFLKEEQASGGIDTKEEAILIVQKYLEDKV